jgi:hypothetical protein
MAYIARADGTRGEIEVPVTLEKAQEVVDGYVERVCPVQSPDIIFLCNEEGHQRNLPFNRHGSELYGGPIAGDIIVMDRREAKGWL